MTNGASTIPVPRWLRQRVAAWQRRCDCEAWEITVYMRKLSGKAAVLTTYVPGYKNAAMEFDPDSYTACTEAEVDRRIAHEFFHLLQSMQETALDKILGDGSAMKCFADEEEHLAEVFAAIMVKAYKRKRP